MATVKAFFRTSLKKTDKVNIRFRLSDGRLNNGGIQLFHKSEITINPEYFDEKKQVYNEKKFNTATPKVRQEFNNSISDRKNLILKLYNAEPIKITLTSSWLDKAIDESLYPEKYIIKVDEPQPETVLSHIRHFVENSDNRKVKKTGQYITSGTKKQYVSTERIIIQFAKHQKKSDFQFSEINGKFYNDFIDYLTNKEYKIKTKKGEVVNEKEKYTANSIGRYVKVLKTMLSDVKGIDLSDFYVMKETIDSVYLNEKELQQLKDFDFSETPYLDRVRDWFLLLSWTGSRFSDLDKIGKSDIKDNFITFRQQKTNTKVTIPLHPVVLEVLKKYNFDMPKAITNQKFNDYIKEVCRLAGLDSIEAFTRTVGGKSISEEMPKYELISSHTGRRNFCTNMYKRGLPTLSIMSISGHKTETSFLTYIKVSQSEHAEMMAKQWEKMYN